MAMSTTKAKQTIQDYIEQANKLREEEKLDRALSLYQEAVKSYHNSYELYHFLGETLAAKNKLDEAIDSYKKSIEINPEFIWSHHCLGQAFFWQGRLDKAIYNAYQALKIEPELAVLHYQLGLYLERKLELDSSIAAYTQALELEPEYNEARQRLEAVLAKQSGLQRDVVQRDSIKNKDDGISDLEKLISQGKSLIEKGDIENALLVFQQGIDLSADSNECYHFLGEALARKNELAKAEDYFRQSIYLNPEYYWSYHCLGQVLLWQGKVDEAISATRKAIEIEPKEAPLHHQLGCYLESQGNRAKAISAYQEAIKIKPGLTIASEALKNLVKNQNEFLDFSDNTDTSETNGHQNLSLTQQTVFSSTSTFEGCLEVIDGCLLKGWVWNSGKPDETQTIIIYKNNEAIGRFAADRFREDLREAGIGTGHYGFAIRLPLDVCQSAPFNLKIIVDNSNYTLQNSLIKFNYDAIYKSSFQGYCEPLTKDGILKGWALDNDNLDNKLTLYVYDNYNFICQIKANLYRKDIHNWKKGDGFYGYSCELLDIICDNKEHKLSICWENSSVELGNSPIIIKKGFILNFIIQKTKGTLNKLVRLASDVAKNY